MTALGRSPYAAATPAISAQLIHAMSLLKDKVNRSQMSNKLPG